MLPHRSRTGVAALFVLLALSSCGGGAASDSPPPALAGNEFGIAARPTNSTCRPPAQPMQPPVSLRATGCVDATAPTHPAPGLIPYGVASPLWSDGAAKQRFMALPEGARIHVVAAGAGGTTDEGHFDFPVGTVLMKSFLFAGKLIETRLFSKTRVDSWTGTSYAWNDEQSDATLVSQDGTTKSITNDGGKSQDWTFPSRSDCLLCHNDVVGFSLGLETRQLNILFDYPSHVRANQIATLEHIGVFDGPVRALPPLPDPGAGSDPATLDDRAHSYLHANCAICHRPGGNFPGIDMRYGVALADMKLCGLEVTKGTAGALPPEAARRLVPAHPEQSVTYTRMATVDTTVRMPQIATAVVDPVGTPLIAAWIKSIAACP